MLSYRCLREGFTTRECLRMVSLSPWIWVLAIGYRCWHIDSISETLRTFHRNSYRPQENHVCWQGRNRLFPCLPWKLRPIIGKARRWWFVQQGDDSSGKDARFWSACQEILPARAFLLQVTPRLTDFRVPLERILDLNSLFKPAPQQFTVSHEGNRKYCN